MSNEIENSVSNAIETSGLVKRFEDYAALDGIDISVPTGAVYGLVGPNGAGKSTLIGHLSGALRPDTGSVRILGQEVYENVAVKSRIACVLGDQFLFTNATLESMARFYHDVNPRFNRARFAELSQVFPLNPHAQLRKFSKGMRKQAAFVLALSHQPDVLLLDEPMDGLDPLMRKTAWGLTMRDVAERGTTVLVSSHNLRELEGICDHLGIMHRGRMLRQYDLTSTEEGLLKVQVVMPEGVAIPSGLSVVKQEGEGRLKTLVIRGAAETVRATLEIASPVLLETMPLSLEEMFLFELGGADDELKNLIL
jgi:ABC-2 type transport system ATP-binding protein